MKICKFMRVGLVILLTINSIFIVNQFNAWASMSIFSDGFDSGNFSAWDGTVGSPTVQSTIVHHGNYAMSVANVRDLVYKYLSRPNIAFARFYLYRTSTPTSNLEIVGLFGDSYVYNVLAYIDTSNVLWLTAPSGDYSSGVTLRANTWYCIEVERAVGSGTGIARLWVNGELKVDRTTETITGGLFEFDLGCVSYSGSATLYFDCIIVSDTYVGIESTPPASSIFRISINNTSHSNYGLAYPVTYIFSIPTSVTSAKCYYKFTNGEAWSELSIKTSDDFFNGINAVRFDYNNHKAFVSIGFSADSDDIYLEFTDENNKLIECSFDAISEYYDDRRAAVVISADDWDGNSARNTAFMNACNTFQNANVWLTVGIVTVGHWYEGAPPIWEDIQSQLDEGFIEVASHSRTHQSVPYDDYDSEIGGSKSDIIGNLSLPSLYRKGDTEYVWAWIEPGGESDDVVRQKLGEYKYLISRMSAGEYSVSAAWDSENGLYNRTGAFCGDELTLQQLNDIFDDCYNNRLIYHMYFHPVAWWIEGGGAWENGIIAEHLDYIKNKKDVWYVGLGALYAYHFVQERGIIQVIPEAPEYLLWSDGFESGGLSEWDAESSGSVQSTVKYSGAYAAQFSGTWQRAQKTLAPLDLAYARIYVYFSDLPSNGNVITIFSFYSSSTFSPDVCVGVKNDGGVVKWGITWDTWQVGSFASSPNPTTGVWYCVELMLNVTEGIGYNYQVWVNGTSIITQSRIHTQTAKFDRFLIGGWDKAEPLTNYIDCVAVADAYVDH